MNGEIWEFDEIGIVLKTPNREKIEVVDSYGNTKKINKFQIKRRINERS